jgi:HEAT repeat protein
MKRTIILGVIVLGLAVLPAPAQPRKAKAAPPDLKGKTVEQVFTDLLPGMGAADIKAREAAQQTWQVLCNHAGAPGNEAMREKVCKLMSDKLGPQTADPARAWLLRQLERIGGAECVDAVAPLLTDKEDTVRDAAVRCLAYNPTPTATVKLLAALPTSRPATRVALINALGYRADPSAVEALADAVHSTESPVALGAAQALGRIGTSEAALTIAAARSKATGSLRAALADAWLRCADRRLAEGKTADAAAIYQALNSPKEPRPVRLAALRGRLRAGGDQAGALTLEVVRGDDATARAVAVGQLADASPAALKAVAAGLEQLTPNVRVVVLNALAARGDRALAAAALAAAKSSDEKVRQAGLLALGRIGDAAAVPLLVEALFKNPPLAGAARASLGSLMGPGVDEKLLQQLKAETEAGKRGELIAVLEARKTVAAVPTLLQMARGKDAGLRGRSLGALRQLAGPADIPALIKVLVSTPAGKEREDAERTVTAVCGQIPEPARRAAPVLAVYRGADRGEQLALLPLLGRIGGPDALEAVRTALASGDAETAGVAAHALCNWPDSTASADLLKLTRNAPDAQVSKEALLALIRVNTVLDERTRLERLAMLKKAMDLASTTAERQQVLDGVATVRHIDAFRYVLPYLDDPTLAQRACRTIVELAHSKNLREPNRRAFEPVLDRVIAMCRDKGLVERAKRYKEGQ